MQEYSTLEEIDVDVPSPFAYGGDRDDSFLDSIANGIDNRFATKLSQGGSLLSRTMINTIGFIATTEIFMAKIGMVETFVPGMTYSKYAKLEYVDQNSVSHTVYATSRGLGNFNKDTSLIANNKWRTVGGESVTDNLYFN